MPDHLAEYVPAAEGGVDGDYLVLFQHGLDRRTMAQTVLAPCGIAPGQVYRTWPAGFGARLSGEQLDAVRRLPGVTRVQQDTEGRPAPHRRVPPERRVEGWYLVGLADGVDPREVAARHGVAVEIVFANAFAGFAARMTDAQLERVRRDPDVMDVEDDAYVELDG